MLHSKHPSTNLKLPATRSTLVAAQWSQFFLCPRCPNQLVYCYQVTDSSELPHDALLAELNIGHYLVGEAVFVGLEAAVRRMRNLMDEAR